MNKTVLTKVGKVFNRDEIVLAVRSFNVETNRLEGREVFIFSDKETGVTFNSNGVILTGRYNPEKGKGSIDFALNPDYRLPWTNIYDTQLKVEIKKVTDKLIANNPIIMDRFNNLKLLIRYYDSFLKYCLVSKYMKISNINNTSTQEKYMNILKEEEVASTENKEIPMQTKENITMSPMKLAHSLRRKYLEDAEFKTYSYRTQLTICLIEAWQTVKHVSTAKQEVAPDLEQNKSEQQILKGRTKDKRYLTFKPGYFYYEDCYGNITKEFADMFEGITIKDKPLTEVDVKWTENAFGQMYANDIPLKYIFVHSKNARIPIVEGRLRLIV